MMDSVRTIRSSADGWAHLHFCSNVGLHEALVRVSMRDLMPQLSLARLGSKRSVVTPHLVSMSSPRSSASVDTSCVALALV